MKTKTITLRIPVPTLPRITLPFTIKIERKPSLKEATQASDE